MTMEVQSKTDRPRISRAKLPCPISFLNVFFLFLFRTNSFTSAHNQHSIELVFVQVTRVLYRIRAGRFGERAERVINEKG